MFEELGLNPWISIWTRPRATIRRIVELSPRKCLPCLYWLYGFPSALGAAQTLSLGESMPIGLILLLAALLAVPLGWISISIFSALLTWTGGWIGGKARFFEVRAAVAWSNVPSVGVIACWIGMLFLFGSESFSNHIPQTQTLQGTQAAIWIALFLIQTLFSVWTFLLLLKTLGEVNGFSAWKGLLNVCIPLVMLFAAAWVLFFVGAMLSVLTN